MKRWIIIFCLLTLASGADARPRGVSPIANVGNAQINVGGLDLVPANFINILHAGSTGFSDITQVGVAQLDTNQYPTHAFTGLISITFAAGAWSAVPYDLIWTAGTKGQWTFLGVNTACSLSGSGGSVSGCAGGNVTLTIDGTGAGSMTFSPSSFVIQMPGTANWGAAGTGNIAMVRHSDVTNGDYAAGEMFTREYRTVLSGLHPKTIRPMGWMLTGCSQSCSTDAKWTYRTPPTALSWRASRFPAGVWAGGSGTSGAITGTDQYTMAAAPDTNAGGWVANEVIQGNLLNAPSPRITATCTPTCTASNGGNVQIAVNSTAQLSPAQSVWIFGISGTTEAGGIQTVLTVDDATHFTINVPFVHASTTSTGTVGTQTLTVTGKSGGAKFISGASGIPIFANFDTMPTGLSSFVYDAILDRVMYFTGGLSSPVPIEAQVNLANKVNANLWATIPWLADDDYITNWATVVRDNLNTGLYFMPEYGNEVGWSFGFPQTQWDLQRGIALGLTIQAGHSWYALRVREAMGTLIPAVWAGRTSRLRRVLAYQAAGDSTTLTYRMKGQPLAPSGTGLGGLGTGNALYNSYTGSADYTNKPNRPVDVVEVIALAPYAGGANLFLGPDISGGTVPSAANTAFYQSLVNLWDAGNTAGAIALVDDDIRQGRTQVQTVTASATDTFTTPLAHGFTTSANLAFQFTGGTSISCLTNNAVYRANTITATTFKLQPFVNGSPSGANVTGCSNGSGTVTVGWIGGNTSTKNVQTLQALNSNWYWFAEWLAASMDGDRPIGAANLRIEQYEGAIEPAGPTAQQCIDLGVTTTNPSGACGALGGTSSVSASIEAWRASNTAALTTQAYFDQFMGLNSNYPVTYGLMAHSKTPAWLVLPGPVGGSNYYPLLTGVLPNSTAFGTYTGFAGWVGLQNFLLKRDIDPASNDNDPMWLNKAA